MLNDNTGRISPRFIAPDEALVEAQKYLSQLTYWATPRVGNLAQKAQASLTDLMIEIMAPVDDSEIQ